MMSNIDCESCSNYFSGCDMQCMDDAITKEEIERDVAIMDAWAEIMENPYIYMMDDYLDYDEDDYDDEDDEY